LADYTESFRCLKPKLHYTDLLWICCTACCTTNPQQIRIVEFGF